MGWFSINPPPISWEEVFRFNLDNVSSEFRKKYKDEYSDQILNFVESEFKKFFFLTKKNSEVQYGMRSKPVDEYWHLVILDTKVYRKLCSLGNGKFIDHIPSYDVDSLSDKEIDKEYTKLIEDMNSFFGPVDFEIWNKPDNFQDFYSELNLQQKKKLNGMKTTAPSRRTPVRTKPAGWTSKSARSSRSNEYTNDDSGAMLTGVAAGMIISSCSSSSGSSSSCSSSSSSSTSSCSSSSGSSCSSSSCSSCSC